MRKLIRNKKGVSPIVSAVIMILVVMIGMTILFAFFVNYSRDFQEGSGSAILESMTVADVWFKNTDPINSCEIWVYNFGKVDVTITEFYVDSNANEDFEDLIIPFGQHRKIVIYHPFVVYNPINPESYVFRVVTSRGTSFEGTYSWW